MSKENNYKQMFMHQYLWFEGQIIEHEKAMQELQDTIKKNQFRLQAMKKHLEGMANDLQPILKINE